MLGVLKELLQGKSFSVAFELIAYVYHGLPAMLGSPDYRKHTWQYCIVRPDDPDIYVHYLYILSLQNPGGEMPRGGPHVGQFAVHLTVKQAAHGDPEDAEVIYSGPIDQYDPNEDWDEVCNYAPLPQSVLRNFARSRPALRFKLPIHVVDTTVMELVANCLDWAKQNPHNTSAKNNLTRHQAPNTMRPIEVTMKKQLYCTFIRRLTLQPWLLNPSLVLVLLCLSAGLPTLFAAEPAADYAAGVDRFLKLGLPDVKDAKYVNVDWRSGLYGERLSRVGNLKMTGNAWLFSEESNKTAKVLVQGVQQLDILHPKALEELEKKYIEEMQAKLKAGQRPSSYPDWAEKPSGQWKPADLQKDIETIQAFLKKSDADLQETLNDEIGGDLFLFALHAYRNGKTALANEFIAQIFKAAGDNRKILSQAMNRLADAQYAKLYEDFIRSGNWQSYLTNMEALNARFSTVWRSRPIVERVITAVRKHLEMKTPPALTAAGLKDEDQKLALELAKFDKPLTSMSMSFGDLWVLGEDSIPTDLDDEISLPDEIPDDSVLNTIVHRRQQAIPMLIALLKDEYLVRVKNSEHEYFSFSSDDAPSEREIEQRYKSFQRPVTRGEIARALLEPLVTEDEERYDSDRRPDTEEIEKRARAWYEKHKDQTRAQLLRFYLTEGPKNTRDTALSKLLGSKDEADRKAVETYLLGSENLARNISYVSSYAARNGDSVKPFVKEYIAKVKALPSLLSADELKYTRGEERKRREDQVRAQLQSLDDLVSDKTSADLLKEIIASDKKWNAEEFSKINQALVAKLQRETNDQAIVLLLDAVTKTKSDFLAQMFLQSLPRFRASNSRFKSSPTSNTPAPLDISKHAKYWKEILNQKREPLNSRYGLGDSVTFIQLASSEIEYLYGSNTEELSLRSAGSEVLGVKIYDIIQKRAEARLDGKTEAQLPPFPDPSKVTDERKSALRKELAALTAETQPQYINKLPYDEVVLLPELLSSDEALSAKLVPASHIIRSISVSVTNDALKKSVQALQGKPIDRKSVEQLLEEVKKQLIQGQSLTVRFSRSFPLAGLELSVAPTPEESPYRAYGGRNMPAFVMGQVSCADDNAEISASAQWKVEGAPKPAPPAAAEPKKTNTDDEDLLEQDTDMFGGDYSKKEQDEFWEDIDKLLTLKINAAAPYQCILIGIAPSTKK
jgi:hypothetical protein